MKKASWIAVFVCAICLVDASAQPFLQPLVTNGLAEPYGVAVDRSNIHYVTDSANNRILRFDPRAGTATNLAGFMGEQGRDDGAGIFARFFSPAGIVYSGGRLIVSDSGNHLIRAVTTNGVVTTLAGNSAGSLDGAGANARFNSPAGLAADGAGNIFVADTLNNRIRMIEPNNNVTTLATATGLLRPSALAVDTNTGDIYVADTGNNAIKVLRTNVPPRRIAGSGIASLIGSRDALLGTNSLMNGPRGLLWVGGNTGLLVSDTGNHSVRRIYNNPSLLTYSVESYFSSPASLRSPVGLAIDQDGNFPLADLGNNALFKVQVTAPQAPVKDPMVGIVIFTNNNFGQLVTFLVPITNSTFFNDIKAAILPTDNNVSTYYTLDPNLDLAANPSAGFSPSAAYSNGLTNWPHPSLIEPRLHGSNVTLRAISTQEGRQPSEIVSGRFQFKVASTVINGNNPGAFSMTNATESAELRYTTDGSDPSTNLNARLYAQGEVLDIVNGTNDIVFRVFASRTGYTASQVEKTFFFADLQTSSIGITRDFLAGVGSTIVVPVEVRITPGDVLKSLQFRAEIAPGTGAPSISTQFRNLDISTNDFIRINPPSTNAPNATSYTSGANTGVAISYVGGTSGLNLSESGVVSMLAVPIPPEATQGRTYTVSILEPSATSDGFQKAVRLKKLRDSLITVTNVSYAVGDSAVATWYNAGDFGNGDLNNNDVNNAFNASLGLFTPYPFADVFDAMDAFPEDSSTAVGGDGQIRFLDWQIILQRSLRLTTNNWKRFWTAGGVRFATNAALVAAANRPASVLASAGADRAWKRQALVQVLSLENVAPGSRIGVPVYLKVAPGFKVAGMQFRAAVDAEGSAPSVREPALFNPNTRLPRPITLQGAQQGLPLNQAVGAWSLINNPFITPLEGTTFLGEVQFTVPATAQAGQSYAVHILTADGSPDLKTQYDFESLPGTVWIGTTALRKTDLISDEWKARFFNKANPALIQAEADPDGDGLSNVEEYLFGSSPIELRFHKLDSDWKTSLKQGTLKLRWFAEAGKQYRIERSGDFKTWTVTDADVTGRGDIAEFVDPNAGGEATFYRVRVETPSNSR
ncbi:MAG: chitobiase/beta-hexosaminidase C-terminal domain-containing protein [Verrucomicrobia bacterium]|nr:chitobiase/beta-hexosaminidase C-terminal domain-containing protein [Verrucomicrobiota bacterium]